MKYFLLVLAFGALAKCEEDNSLEVALNFLSGCKGDYILCAKERALKIVDNLKSKRSIEIVDGVVFKSDSEVRSPKKLDALPVDPTARDAEVNYRLVEGIVSLFETHAVEVKMNDADKEVVQRSLEEGRGKKNKGGMGALIGLLGAKVIFGKLLLIKLIALKALATAKIAIVLTVILFIAWCLKQEHTKTTYEVIPHAHHHEAHHHETHHPIVEHLSHDAGHGYSGFGSDWNKNIDDAQGLAYSGYGHAK